MEEITGSEDIIAAVIGCTHGQLDTIYDSIADWERQNNSQVDLILCCGDFEAVRNEYDLNCLCGPKKYHIFKDFYKYYNGEKVAPKLTLFIGGNHESVNHLRELYYGGWVAPNIYFLGYSGVVNFGGVRIAGFSGIFKSYDFYKGHFEKPPYDENSKRSSFHVKQYELWKLQQIRSKLDVIMSHDWPNGITKFGDEAELLRQCPHYGEEIEKDGLGCKYYTALMQQHKPQWWLSGHMHVFFKATVNYPQEVPETSPTTNFMACTKAVPYTNFLHVIHIKPSIAGIAKQLFYDPEWLAILKSMEVYFPQSKVYSVPKIFDYSTIENAMNWVSEEIVKKGLIIPHNFTITVTPHWTDKSSGKPKHKQHETDLENNIQTITFRKWLELDTIIPQESEKLNQNKKPQQSNDKSTLPKKRVQHFQ